MAGLTALKEFKALRQLSQTSINLRQAFDQNPQRTSQLSIHTPHMYYDYSRQLVDAARVSALCDLARAVGLQEKIDAMFRGDKINTTENRAVLHVALRNLSSSPIYVDGKDVMPEVNRVLGQVKQFSEEILNGQRRGVTGKPIKNIISIGIGGSYLGMEYLAEACAPYAQKGMQLRFVANVDPTDFARKTAGLDREETLVIVKSKTFTTPETMLNALRAKEWMLLESGDTDPKEIIKKHFIAVSTAADLVSEFGIATENMFEFWDWVGGRYSATSAVGAVPLSLYLGYDNFKKILEGAAWMDEHYRTAPFKQNIPIMSALIDIWNRNVLGFPMRALLPYSQAWGKLPAHTQQVEMESNGKRVTIGGMPVDYATGEVVFGEPGTNGQHSFYQLIHQSPLSIPCDFIGAIQPQYPLGTRSNTAVSSHDELMTNFLAQPDALAFGKNSEDPHRFFPGNKPSSSLLLNAQTPFEAGILLAWTEHRAATKGFIWDINSFDQFGVELGKVLGKDMRERIKLYCKDPLNPAVYEGLNPSTVMLFRAYLTGGLPV